MVSKVISQDMKEKMFNIIVVRNMYFIFVLIVSKTLLKLGYHFYGPKIFMEGFRIIYEESYFKTKKSTFDTMIKKRFNKHFKNLVKNYVFTPDGNLILKSYQESKIGYKIRKKFLSYDSMHRASMKFPRKNDYAERQGDLIILKKYNKNNNEKGVIYISYTEGIGRFAALYDIDKLASKYQFVFEPSWWGYQNALLLLYYGINTDIVIECPYFKDKEFIKYLNYNFHQSELGFGDWVDDDKFNTKKYKEKDFDIVMVGNWGKVKRHEVLFKAVKKMTSKPKIALIGYPAFQRTKMDIVKEAKRHGIDEICTFYEKIPPSEVADILSRTKVNVLLSKGEGANRGIYEGMFCGNVVVVYKNNKGVNLNNINQNTGYLSGEDELPQILETAIRNYEKFDTRKWAEENTGYKKATKILNTQLKKITLQKGYLWTENIVSKKNLPNLVYAKESDRKYFESEYMRISKYLL